MATYGDFGAGGYPTLTPLPVENIVAALPALSITPVKPSQPTSPLPKTPKLGKTGLFGRGVDVEANQAINDSQAHAAFLADRTDNIALGALTVPNPITGI